VRLKTHDKEYRFDL
jgi:hypothetical protein